MRTRLSIRRQCFPLVVVLSLCTIASSPSTAQTITWIQTGGPFQGRVEALAWYSGGPFFAGTSDSGTFRSTDGGVSWVKSNTGLTKLSVYALVTKAGGPLFAGTGQGAIFRSDDNAGSWVQAGIGLTSTTVRALLVNAAGSVLAGTFGGGIFVSTNNGGSWSPANTGLADTLVQSLSMNRQGLLFAATYRRGVFRSTNNGGLWTQVKTGLTDSSVNALAVDSSGHLFAGTTSGGIFHSTDNGDHWIPANSGLPPAYRTITAIGTRPDGAILAAVLSRGIYSSTDDGSTWSLSRQQGESTRIIASGPGAGVFAGGGDGLFRQYGGGWRQVGVRKAQVLCVISRPGGRLLAGISGTDGVFVSSDNGATWSSARIDTNALRFLLSLTVDHHGHILAGTQGGLYLSTDEGLSWSWAGATGADMFHAVAVAPNGYLFGASGSNYTYAQLFRSTDDGKAWTRILQASPPPPPLPPQYSKIEALACDGTGGLWASSSTFGIPRSTDYGTSWAGNSYPAGTVSALVADQSGIVMAGGTRGIFRSTDRGLSWLQSNTGLSDTIVYALARNPSNHILAGTRTGVFRSTSAGVNWSNASSGLSNSAVTVLFVDGEGFAVAGTLCGGVYRTLATTVAVELLPESEPTALQLYQNYPNPFNPATSIHYQLSTISNVRLTVFDLLGREVAVLVNESRGPGIHRVSFDGSGLASGIYTYRLAAGQFIQARRMILLR